MPQYHAAVQQSGLPEVPLGLIEAWLGRTETIKSVQNQRAELGSEIAGNNDHIDGPAPAGTQPFLAPEGESAFIVAGQHDSGQAVVGREENATQDGKTFRVEGGFGTIGEAECRLPHEGSRRRMRLVGQAQEAGAAVSLAQHLERYLVPRSVMVGAELTMIRQGRAGHEVIGQDARSSKASRQ